MQIPYYTYEEFPENMSATEGMRVIYGQDEVGIKGLPDTVYAVKDGMELHIKMLVPREINENKKYPTIFHVQGSAWYEQNLNSNVGNLSTLVRAGYCIVLIEYRFAPRHRFPCQVEDGKTAVRYVMEHAAEYPIDTNNIFLSGDSSGGHTAMMMMATWESGECDAEKTPLPKLNACIDLYGSVNLLTMNQAPSAYDHDAMDSPATNYLGFSAPADPAECARRMPHYYINESTSLPPVLIMHGSKDRTVPFSQSLEFYEHLKKNGKDAVFYKVKNADHGGNVFYCRATMRVILDFLNEHLR